METLLLDDATYVYERYQEIVSEKRRQSMCGRGSASSAPADQRSWSQMVDGRWEISPLDMRVQVVKASLHQLASYCTEYLCDEAHLGDETAGLERGVGSVESKPLREDQSSSPQMISSDTGHFPDLPPASQLTMKLFFRLCRSLRHSEHHDRSVRAVSTVATKIPTILSSLPPCAVSPEVAGKASDAHFSGSVFKELLDVFGRVLGEGKKAIGEKNECHVEGNNRAQVIAAYVAVSIKLGRLRELVQALILLIKYPDTLDTDHIVQLHSLLSSLHTYEPEPIADPLPESEITATGFLLSFGKGDHGKLGHGQCTHPTCAESNCTENKMVPTTIASTMGVQFVKIDSLSTHSIAVTTKGEVMAWGNGDKYRLGHGTVAKEYAPRIIDSLSLKGKVSDVACGLGHTLALMSNGDIYGWGNGSNGRLGLGDNNDRSTPTKVAMSADPSERGPTQRDHGSAPALAVRSVICGASHSLALTIDGRVFSWGKNNQGQCGHGHTNDQFNPAEITVFRNEMNERIIHASGGWEHTLYCSASGRVYSSGCGYKDSRRTGIPPVLGHGDNEKRLKPAVIQAFIDASEEMVRVACGWDHSLAISSHGALYTWGSGANGKLGHGDEENCEVPTLVRSFCGKIVKDAKAGCEHTVVLTADHELWTFGQGDSGRLGLGDAASRKLPTKVDVVTHCGLHPVAIAVGDKYNLVIAEEVDGGKVGGQASPRHREVGTGRPRHRESRRSRRSVATANALKQREGLSRSDRGVGRIQDTRGASDLPLPKKQDELVLFIAEAAKRIATRYLTESDEDGYAQHRTLIVAPYSVDVCGDTLQNLVELIQLCHANAQRLQDKKKRAVVLACLRLLTVNICFWQPTTRIQEESSRDGYDHERQIFNAVQKLLDDLTSQDEEDVITREFCLLMRRGARFFLPTVADRENRLWEMLSSPSKQSVCDSELLSQLLKDSVIGEVVLSYFTSRIRAPCNQLSSAVSSEISDPPGKTSTDFIDRLVNVITSSTTLMENSSMCQGVGVIQAHLFAVVQASFRTSNASLIDESSVNALVKYLATVFERSLAFIKTLHQDIRQGALVEDASSRYRFLDGILHPALHMLLALFESSNASTLEDLVRERLLHRGETIFRLLDEIEWKTGASEDNNSPSNNKNTTRVLVELGVAFAALCGHLSSRGIRSKAVETASRTEESWQLLHELWSAIDVTIDMIELSKSHQSLEDEDDSRLVALRHLEDLKDVETLVASSLWPKASQVHASPSKTKLAALGLVIIALYSGMKLNFNQALLSEHKQSWAVSNAAFKSFASCLRHTRDADIDLHSALDRARFLVRSVAPKTKLSEEPSQCVSKWTASLARFLTLPAPRADSIDLDTCLHLHGRWSDQVIANLAQFAELLQQVSSPNLKKILLSRLHNAVMTLPTSIKPKTANEETHLSTTVDALLSQMTLIIRDPLYCAESRANAIGVWLWVIKGCCLSRAALVEFITKTGIVSTLSDVLLRDSRSDCADFAPQRTDSGVRSIRHATSKIQPVEELLDGGESDTGLRSAVHELFASIARILCRLDVQSRPSTHPLAAAVGRWLNRPASAARPGSSSPRRRNTLPRRADVTPVSEMASLVFDTVLSDLRVQVTHNNTLLNIQSPFKPSSAQHTTAFLLSSPLWTSPSKGHIVKSVKLQSSSTQPITSSSISHRSVSSWIFIENTQVTAQTELPSQTIINNVVAVGQVGDRSPEAAMKDSAMLLRASDCLQLIVFTVHDSHMPNLVHIGLSVKGETNDNGTSFATRVSKECVPVGRWIHLLIMISDCFEPKLFVNGVHDACVREASWMEYTCSSSPTTQIASTLVSVDSHTQAVCGGVPDAKLLETMGFSRSAQHIPSASASEDQPVPGCQLGILVDDVWFFDEIDAKSAADLCKQGPAFVQVHREHQNATQHSKTTQLLHDLLELHPLNGEHPTQVGESVQAMFEMLVQSFRQSLVKADIDSAQCAVEVLERILVSIVPPTSKILDQLGQNLTLTVSGSAGLHQDLLSFHTFSARAGIQSPVVAASLTAVVTSLVERGILDLSATPREALTRVNKTRTAIQAALTAMLQRLWFQPRWNLLITERLEQSLARLSKVQSSLDNQSEDVLSCDEAFISILSCTPSTDVEVSSTRRTWPGVRYSSISSISESSLAALWRIASGITDPTITLAEQDGTGPLTDVQVSRIVRLQAKALGALLLCASEQHDDRPTQDRLRMLWNEESLTVLLRLGTLSRVDVLRSRFGACEQSVSQLKSVRTLFDGILRRAASLSWFQGVDVDDDLEPLARQLALYSPKKADEEPSPWRQTRPYRSPLEAIEGDVRIRGLTVHAIQHFPTVRLNHVAITASSGLWYHEVLILTDGLMQIGYVDSDFTSDPIQGQGVGDHTNSWAYDGYRRKKWNVTSAEYGELWRAGDIVGVLLDTDRCELSYFLNGVFLGVAFASIPLTPTSVMLPAVSLNADQRIRFNIGTKNMSDAVEMAEALKNPFVVWRLTLPSLKSPLDRQRLQPVVFAMDDEVLQNERASENMVLFDSDDSDEEPSALDDDGQESDLLKSDTSRSSPIYDPRQSTRRGHALPLPGAMDTEMNGLLSIGLRAARRRSRGDKEDDDSSDDDRGRGDRESELLDGLIALGFPRSWAIRCATETSFSINDSGAVSWILEQMEHEATQAAAQERLAMDLPTAASLDDVPKDRQSLPRQAQDDLSLLQATIGNRRVWQLSLSPNRPQSEQYERNPITYYSSSPTKSQSQQAKSSTPLEDISNPFLQRGFEDDEDDNDWAGEEAASSASMTATHQFYVSSDNRTLQRRWQVFEQKRTELPSPSVGDGTTRSAEATLEDEDLLPAIIFAHTLSSVAHARLLAVAVLLSPRAETERVYRVIASGGTSDLFKLLRFQLRLNHRELPFVVDRLRALTQDQQMASAMRQLVQFELGCKQTGQESLPLLHAIQAEIHTIVSTAANAPAHSISRATTLTKEAMNARWVTWLLTVWSEAIEAENGEIVVSEVVIAAVEAMFLIDFVRDLVAIAAAATSTNSVWRIAAFSMIKVVLAVDAAVKKIAVSPSTATTRVSVRFFVELLARQLRSERSNCVSASEFPMILWQIAMDHVPVSIPTWSTRPPSSELATLCVDHITATRVSITWQVNDPSAEPAAAEGSTLENQSLTLQVVSDVSTNMYGGMDTSNAWLASDAPRALPSKGSLILRRLASDTWYTIRLIKSTTTTQQPIGEQNEDGGALVSSNQVVVAEVRVRTPPEPVFELDCDACGGNLVVLNRNRSAKNQVNKKWNTIRATVAFEEGVHHWHVRIDSCVSKNIFIGVATEDASLDNYIGSDAFGYGFLANKAVWHNKSKVQSYGEIFKQGDLLQVTLDCDARTLSFSRNGEPMGIAASNLHVTGGGSSDELGGHGSSQSTSCKWYPAISLYNKDDQVTLIMPPSAGFASLRPVSQCASVQAMILSTRIVLETALGKHAADADAKWQMWKNGNLGWREVAIGDVIEIDTTRDTVQSVFSFAPGDSVFTGRGHCVVLGASNHELWYEVCESIGDTRPAGIGSWSLHTCKEMISAPDEYPIHRRRIHSASDPWMESISSDPNIAIAECDAEVQETPPNPSLDELLLQLIDALAANRGLSSPFQLSYSEITSALSLHNILETLSRYELSAQQVLQHIFDLLDLNQHVNHALRFFLSPTAFQSWEHALVSMRELESSEQDKGVVDEAQVTVAAARLAAALTSGISRPEYAFLTAAGSESIDHRQAIEFARAHLFESQRERMITEAMRRSITPTDPVPLDTKTDDLPPHELPTGLPKIYIRSVPKLQTNPFWDAPALHLVVHDAFFGVPHTEDLRSVTRFGQISAQLRAMPPHDLRRGVSSSTDPLPVSRTFDVVVGGDAVVMDPSSLFLTLLDAVFIEVQSPAFPLFVPVDRDDLALGQLELDINTRLLLPEFASRCHAQHEEVVLWYYQVGQLLGVTWRARAILPLQFLSCAFWEELVGSATATHARDHVVGDTLKSRLGAARAIAMRAVRDGLCTVVPSECLLLSIPDALKSHLSARDMFTVETLRHHAAYDHDASHHAMFWEVLGDLSSLEKQIFRQFIRVRSSHWPVENTESPVDQWKRLAMSGHSTQAPTTQPFVLHLDEPLVDARAHPNVCFPVVDVVDQHSSRLHLPVYSSAHVLRQKLRLAMASLPPL